MAVPCKNVRHLVSAYLDNELGPHFRESIAAHLRHCWKCRSLALAEVRLLLRLKRLKGSEKAPLSLRLRLQKALRQADKKAGMEERAAPLQRQWPAAEKFCRGRRESVGMVLSRWSSEQWTPERKRQRNFGGS